MRIVPRVRVCVWLGGLCVRGAEHLNINNCHAGHLGPHSQLAPRAHSHHQHSCHGEQEEEEGGAGEEGLRRRERERKATTKHSGCATRASCASASWERLPKCRNEQRGSLACEAFAASAASPFKSTAPVFCPGSLMLPAESSAYGASDVR